jgi:hypothetical protein
MNHNRKILTLDHLSILPILGRKQQRSTLRTYKII